MSGQKSPTSDESLANLLQGMAAIPDRIMMTASFSAGVLIGIGVLAILALILAIWACVRLVQQQRQYQALLTLLRSEVDLMSHSTIGVGQRLVDVEKRLNQTVDRQQRMEGRESGGASITQAAKLMEMGASVDDVIANCGIGRPEAELIALLHREIRPEPRKRVRQS